MTVWRASPQMITIANSRWWWNASPPPPPPPDGATVNTARVETAAHELLAVARLSRIPNTGDAEFAVLIRDDMQKQGLGTTLLMKLIEIARAEGLKRIVGEILPENIGMKRVTEKLGFNLKYDIEEGLTHAVLDL